MYKDNVEMLRDTLAAFDRGYYTVNGRRVDFKLSKGELTKATVFLPQDVDAICKNKEISHVHALGRIGCRVENTDSFSLARKRYTELSGLLMPGKKSKILVLNLANPVHPGGGVRRGAKAQEEDLCRKSSLLLSLESADAEDYYDYNRSLNTYMGSDAIIITPNVEIIKDENGNYLDESVVVSVMTCAAPMVTQGFEGMSELPYRDMVYNRIVGMLKTAAYLGYEVLILGAFGCGAFGNDARIVSDLFYKALKEFDYDGMKAKDFFRRVDFAVWCQPRNTYNYDEFARNFNDFYRDEDAAEAERVLAEIKASEVNLDRIRGCMIGGAVGDALGYAIEFSREGEIFGKYGPNGITEYKLTDGKALISDDTQMTLFTANGLLVGETRGCMRGIMARPRSYVAYAYRDWLMTQSRSYESVHTEGTGYSWLLDVPEMFASRAPGNTCLSALRNRSENERDYIGTPINDSKGCGGVMRVAPVALKYAGKVAFDELDMEAAQIAAITHSHSLGYMPAAVLTHIIGRVVTDDSLASLENIVEEAVDKAQELFRDNKNIGRLARIIGLAIQLSHNDAPDIDNIHALGEGWVAEETLAIAVYCALKYRNDFSKAITVSVNHNGDSDSTGAVTGNILGAWVGYDAIDPKWKRNLELHDVVLEMADDLCHGCRISEYSSYSDPAWESKYIGMHRYITKKPMPAGQPTFTFFWKDDEENAVFSNWYPARIVIDDFEYFCVEQYMMAQKAKLFHDSARYTAILRANTPARCKALGKQVTPFDAAAWDKVKYAVVKQGNHAKYGQNPELMQRLLATGDSVIAEASPKDKIWGIGLTADKASKLPPDQWPGENLLGRILMELREEFK